MWHQTALWCGTLVQNGKAFGAACPGSVLAAFVPNAGRACTERGACGHRTRVRCIWYFGAAGSVQRVLLRHRGSYSWFGTHRARSVHVGLQPCQPWRWPSLSPLHRLLGASSGHRHTPLIEASDSTAAWCIRHAFEAAALVAGAAALAVSAHLRPATVLAAAELLQACCARSPASAHASSWPLWVLPCGSRSHALLAIAMWRPDLSVVSEPVQALV